MAKKPRRASTKTSAPVGRSTVGEICSVIKHASWALVVCFGVYELRGCIEALAGKDTFAKIAIGLLADFKVSIAWMAAASAAGVAVRERRLRQKTVERLEGRIHELETDIDPHRTSSHLTKTGQTNPGDR